MKRSILSIAVLCGVTVFAVVSCQKSYNNNYAGAAKSLNQLFADLRTETQHFSVAAGRDTVLVGAKGTKLHLYTNSFKNKDGEIITAGNVNLDLTEMVQAGDMIQNRATTTLDDGQPLISGGQVNLKVTMSGQEVFANKYGIGFKQNAPSTQPMQLFVGNTNNEDSVVTWKATPTGVGRTASGTRLDSVKTPSGSYVANYRYIFDSCTDFNFVNCDHPFTSGSSEYYTQIAFHDLKFKYSNIQVFMYFPAYKTITNLRDWKSRRSDKSIDTFNGSFYIPSGSECKVVIIANVQEKYYYFQRTDTANSDTIKIIASMVEETRSDIISRMAGL